MHLNLATVRPLHFYLCPLVCSLPVCPIEISRQIDRAALMIPTSHARTWALTNHDCMKGFNSTGLNSTLTARTVIVHAPQWGAYRTLGRFSVWEKPVTVQNANNRADLVWASVSCCTKKQIDLNPTGCEQATHVRAEESWEATHLEAKWAGPSWKGVNLSKTKSALSNILYLRFGILETEKTVGMIPGGYSVCNIFGLQNFPIAAIFSGLWRCSLAASCFDCAPPSRVVEL